jgi:hypothetical protein
MALSYVQKLGDGTTRNFDFTFDYLSRKHIAVTVDGVPVPFTWTSTYSILAATAPAALAVVEVRRTTPRTERLVSFSDGSTLVATDLNTSTLQSFFLAQEAFDQGAASMTVTEDGQYSAGTRRVTLVGDPVAPQDVVNLRYFNGTFLPQLNALLNSSTAASNTAMGFRNEAQTARTGAEAARTAAESVQSAVFTARDTTIAARDASITARTGSETARTEAEAARDSASGHRLNAQNAKNAADADVVLTHADVLLTAADRVATAADRVATNADRVQTAADRAAAAASAASIVPAQFALKAGTTFTGSISAPHITATVDRSDTVGPSAAEFIGSSGYWGLRTDNGNRMNIDVWAGGSPKIAMQVHQAGQVTKPLQPSFSAYHAVANYALPGGVNVLPIPGGVQHNIGGHYSTSTGRFTAPVVGTYLFRVLISTLGNAPANAYLSAELRINGVRSFISGYAAKAEAGYHHASGMFLVKLNPGDYVEAGCETSAPILVSGGSPYTSFAGVLLA